MIKNVKIVIIYAFKSKFYQDFVFTKEIRIFVEKICEV